MIRVERLEKKYGQFTALHPLDLEIRAGEVFGFLGPNGAGKTTTIRLLAGVLPSTSGRVWIDGLDLAAEPEKARARIGYIPDRPYLYEKLTGFEFLEFIVGVYGLPKGLVRTEGAALLDSHGLMPFADQLIEGYSHGMKQRLVLASALLHKPRVFIVDEPMVGLDPMGARQIKDVFRRVAAEGRTVFLSTHSLDVAQEVCDRIGIIHRGRLVALGTLADLKSQRSEADLEEVFLRVVEEEAAASRGEEAVA